MVKEKAAFAFESGDWGWSSGMGYSVTDASMVCSTPVHPRNEVDEPESTTRELTSLRYPSCSTGFLETVIVLVNVALPESSKGTLSPGVQRLRFG